MNQTKHSLLPPMINETDARLINALLEDSSQSLRELAKQAKVSPATAMHRIRQLEKAKIIKQYTVLLDYDSVGYDLTAVIEFRIAKGKLAEVEQKIASHQNVFALYDVTGDFDAVVIAKFQSRRKLDSFLKKIQTFPFIERTQTKIVLNTIKEKPVIV